MSEKITAPLTGNVWKIVTKPGDALSEGDEILIMESMKMEIPIEAPVDGTLTVFHCKEGDSVLEGQLLAVMEES